MIPHFLPPWCKTSLRASRASESFARLFKGGGVQGRSPCPRSAERGTLLCFIKHRRGFKGEPSPGVPPFSLRFYVCAVMLGGGLYPLLLFDPISLVLAQRNGVEPPKKSAFLPWWLHHSRERCCLGGRDVPRPTWGGGWCGSGAVACAGQLGALSLPSLMLKKWETPWRGFPLDEVI